jgi:hypothetical protein
MKISSFYLNQRFSCLFSYQAQVEQKLRVKTMFYVIAAIVIVAIIIIVPFIRRSWVGNRLVSSLLTGEFDQSTAGQEMARWFKERPTRVEQRDLFVQVALGLGCPRGIVADRLMGCIMKVWRGDGARFGNELAEQIDGMIVFDPPSTPEQTQLQQVALQKFSELKAKLRSLD